MRHSSLGHISLVHGFTRNWFPRFLSRQDPASYYLVDFRFNSPSTPFLIALRISIEQTNTYQALTLILLPFWFGKVSSSSLSQRRFMYCTTHPIYALNGDIQSNFCLLISLWESLPLIISRQQLYFRTFINWNSLWIPLDILRAL